MSDDDIAADGLATAGAFTAEEPFTAGDSSSGMLISECLFATGISSSTADAETFVGAAPDDDGDDDDDDEDNDDDDDDDDNDNDDDCTDVASFVRLLIALASHLRTFLAEYFRRLFLSFSTRS